MKKQNDGPQGLNRRSFLSSSAVGAAGVMAAAALVATDDASAVGPTPSDPCDFVLPRKGIIAATGTKRGTVGVLVEHHYDGEVYRQINQILPAQGYEVHYLSFLWNNPDLPYESTPEPIAPGSSDYAIKECVMVEKCVSPTWNVNNAQAPNPFYANPDDYDAIILINSMAMDQLRFMQIVSETSLPPPPPVTYVTGIMEANKKRAKKTIIAALQNGLWLLTATNALKGRKVTCGHGAMFDVKNAGGVIQYGSNKTKDVHTDGDLVTARGPEVVGPWLNAVMQAMGSRQS